MNKPRSYDMRCLTSLKEVSSIIETYHGYGSVAKFCTYIFVVYENNLPVAVYTWQPPPIGGAKAACPEAPSGVLALSRMVAIPKSWRKLKHVSKPLRAQMMHEIDRGRWPVLITFSDEGQGHTGHVYKCSGWQKTTRARRRFHLDTEGRRASYYCGGRSGKRNLTFGGYAWLQRWEHRVCPPGAALQHMEAAGWHREVVPGKVWKSGNQAHRWVKVPLTEVQTITLTGTKATQSPP